ncbi:MAG: hypothetical protein ACYC99_17345 [Candidatus Geothermincolia bacterium]
MSSRRRSVFIWGPDGVVHVHKPSVGAPVDEDGQPYNDTICGARVPFPPVGVSAERVPTCGNCLSLTGITPSMFDQEAS